MQKLLSVILFLSYSLSAGAQVTYVEKNTPAPYTGYLFTPQAELDNRKLLEERKTLLIKDENNQTIIELKNKLITDTQAQADLWHEHSNEMAKELARRESNAFWRSAGFFTLGAGVTLLLVKAVAQVAR